MIYVKRHIAKTITYRILGTLTTVIISYIFTRNLTIAGSMGFVELIIKPIIYFIHERVWYKYIKFGLTDKKEE
jgi:uncharacterized membrane protein